jgi:cobalt/nickel transport system permease protein
MHISDGILPVPVILGGGIMAAGLLAAAMRKTEQEDIPRISALGAAFFVSSLLHVRIGPSSAHLSLIGLIGILLGRRSVLAIIAGLFFQALMFQHGGILALGVNTVIMAVPALIASLLFRAIAGRCRGVVIVCVTAGLASGAAVLCAALLSFASLLSSGEQFRTVALVFSVADSMIALGEGVITAIVVGRLLKAHPEMLPCAHAGSFE